MLVDVILSKDNQSFGTASMNFYPLSCRMLAVDTQIRTRALLRDIRIPRFLTLHLWMQVHLVATRMVQMLCRIQSVIFRSFLHHTTLLYFLLQPEVEGTVSCVLFCLGHFGVSTWVIPGCGTSKVRRVLGHEYMRLHSSCLRWNQILVLMGTVCSW